MFLIEKEFEEETTCFLCENSNTYTLEHSCSHLKSYVSLHSFNWQILEIGLHLIPLLQSTNET